MSKISEFYDSLDEFLNDEDKIIDDLVEEISNGVCDDLDEMFERNINQHFYKRYNPHRYRRKGSLFKTYKIKKTKSGVSWDFSPEYMPEGLHRADNEYIFQKSFIEGFHGGADRINKVEESRYKQPHPDGVTPYWRTPFPNAHLKIENPYQFWYSTPALQESISPMKGIEMDLKNYWSGKSPTSTKKKYKDRVEDAFSLIKGRYRLFGLLKGK